MTMNSMTKHTWMTRLARRISASSVMEFIV